ncbi:hypothetical protein BgiBS90_030458 [Biomphalaria glabrata]|nr:hypothetical protein BgiBS90_030458 [Biomphalaria glabrata]
MPQNCCVCPCYGRWPGQTKTCHCIAVSIHAMGDGQVKLKHATVLLCLSMLWEMARSNMPHRRCCVCPCYGRWPGQTKTSHTDVAVSVHAMGDCQVKLKHATVFAVSIHAMGDGQVKLKHATQTLLCLFMLWEMARSN